MSDFLPRALAMPASGRSSRLRWRLRRAAEGTSRDPNGFRLRATTLRSSGSARPVRSRQLAALDVPTKSSRAIARQLDSSPTCSPSTRRELGRLEPPAAAPEGVQGAAGGARRRWRPATGRPPRRGRSSRRASGARCEAAARRGAGDRRAPRTRWAGRSAGEPAEGRLTPSRPSCAAPGTARPRGSSSRPLRIITSRSMPMPMPPVGRHAVLERAHVVLVVGLGLLVARGLVGALLLEARALLVRVVQLREGVGELHAGGEALEALDQPGSERWSLANGESSFG